MEVDIQYSVVIPVFNVKTDYLRQCVDSILQYSSDGLEILLVDDKSTNGCEVTCDEYAALDKRVKVFHQQENMGVSEARNLGIRNSRGEWVVFVDSDDWLEAGSLELVSEHIHGNADIIMFSALRESVNASMPFGSSEGVVSFLDDKSDHTLCELRDRLLKQSLKSTHPMYDTVKYCWGKAFRRLFLIENDILFPPLSYCEDIVFMCRALQKATAVIQMPEHLYHYRMTGTSVVNSYRPNALAEQKTFVSLMQETCGKDTDTLFFAALLSMQICLTRYFYNTNNKKSIVKKRMETTSFFSQYPYSEVFKHISCSELKRADRVKDLLIKYKLFFLYYLGTNIRKIKEVRYR